MAIRLVALDLDGTLLNSRSEVSPRNQAALAAAHEQGIEVVVVTGRRFHSALKFVRQIAGNPTVISSNGARIGFASGEVAHRDFLPRDLARQVIAAAGKFTPFAVAIFDIDGPGQLLMQQDAHPDGPLSWYLRTSPEYLHRTACLATAIDRDPIHVTFGGKPEFIEPVQSLLSALPIAPKLQLTWTRYLTRQTSLLDVMNLGCTKGSALARWAAERHIKPHEVMAFGDNFNDVEMLQFAGHPLLMGNHSQGLEREGWPITLSHDEDGVAYELERRVLGRTAPTRPAV